MKLGQVEIGLNIAKKTFIKPLTIISGNYLPKLTKVKIGQLRVSSNITQNQKSSIQEDISVDQK